jgi:hypothetical protein
MVTDLKIVCMQTVVVVHNWVVDLVCVYYKYVFCWRSHTIHGCNSDSAYLMEETFIVRGVKKQPASKAAGERQPLLSDVSVCVCVCVDC